MTHDERERMRVWAEANASSAIYHGLARMVLSLLAALEAAERDRDNLTDTLRACCLAMGYPDPLDLANIAPPGKLSDDIRSLRDRAEKAEGRNNNYRHRHA